MDNLFKKNSFSQTQRHLKRLCGYIKFYGFAGVLHLLRICFFRSIAFCGVIENKQTEKKLCHSQKPQNKPVFGVSVLIPVYDRSSDILFLLLTLRRQINCELQIMIVGHVSNIVLNKSIKQFDAEIFPANGTFDLLTIKQAALAHMKFNYCLLISANVLPADTLWLYQMLTNLVSNDYTVIDCSRLPSTKPKTSDINLHESECLLGYTDFFKNWFNNPLLLEEFLALHGIKKESIQDNAVII